ncbi:MAG TPA: prepilin-type N-terminal cleavage/methylation domain-containing protein [Candidatus Pacearchaeota archaeon]|nr:prepilin-type N-terminal cleavage/methylation domain-containing protein [Candidatus Pacearchaeota archaeon]
MNNKGFTLIEVLLSVFIITVAVLGLYNGINYSYNSIEKAKEKFTAAYLAEEGIELVKNLRDSNFVSNKADWLSGLTGCASSYGCRMDHDDSSLTANIDSTQEKTLLWIDANGFYNYTATGTQTIFSRKILITTISADKIKVSVTVYYGDQYFLLEQYLYNWM